MHVRKRASDLKILLIRPDESIYAEGALPRVRQKRKAYSIPLGLLTVGALLPSEWDIRLLDLSVDPRLADNDILWADYVFLGGMFLERQQVLRLIQRIQNLGKRVVVGGPDATESPGIYETADFLISGEAETILPQFISDLKSGGPKRFYGAEKAKFPPSLIPIPRHDLVKASDYIHAAIQFGRGCPFLCEFCSVPEISGRLPRFKSPEQITLELTSLLRRGFNGRVNVVDDNMISNQKAIQEILSAIVVFQKKHDFPFEFSGYLTMNISSNDSLIELFARAGFKKFFIGIESSEEEVLESQQKIQNRARSARDTTKKIYSFGIGVTAGLVLGEDKESIDVAKRHLRCLEEAAIPVFAPALLTAQPGTRLFKRLESEGRMLGRMDDPLADEGQFFQWGLNFITVRPRIKILQDFSWLFRKAQAPRAYFRRVRSAALLFRFPLAEVPKRSRGMRGNRFGVLFQLLPLFLKAPIAAVECVRTVIFCRMKNPKAMTVVAEYCAMYFQLREKNRIFFLQSVERLLLSNTQPKDSVSGSFKEWAAVPATPHG